MGSSVASSDILSDLQEFPIWARRPIGLLKGIGISLTCTTVESRMSGLGETGVLGTKPVPFILELLGLHCPSDTTGRSMWGWQNIGPHNAEERHLCPGPGGLGTSFRSE